MNWLLAALGVCIALPLLGFIYQQVGVWSDRRKFPPPGKMLRVAGADLHVCGQGSGSPLVLFESGIAASSLSWSYAQPDLAKDFKTVSYDRAGLGWSTLPRAPLHLEMLLAHLQSVFTATPSAENYILVGHSFGSLLVRAFAAAHPASVAGLVLVDPVSIESWSTASPSDLHRLRAGAYFSRRGALLARFGVVRLALALASLRHKRLTTTIAKVSAGKATPTLTRLVGEIQKLPPATLPMVRAEWSLPKCFEAMARHLEILPQCAAAVAAMDFPINIPIIVLSAATATENERREREQWLSGRTHSSHQVIPETGHWLHLERPDLVTQAVRQIAANL